MRKALVRRLLACATAVTPMATPAFSHPHIFVDTGLSIVADADGRPSGIEVTWRYDELYSLLMFEEMGLDSDYDGKLTAEELAKLAKFDMQWIEGFEGDLYVADSDGPLKLGPPEPISTVVEDGRIETRHFRPFVGAVPERLVIRAYDPTYYTAYDLTRGIQAPESCKVRTEKADLAAAQARLAKELDGRPMDGDDFPEVGDSFADTVTLTCGTGS